MLGQLVVRLGLDAADFVRGITRAEHQASRALDAMGGKADTQAKRIESAFKSISTAAGTYLSFKAVQGVLDSIAGYQDLADQIGDTAVAIAGLQEAADLSGTALSEVAQASARMTTTFAKGGTEAKNSAAALAAINIQYQEFQRLSPAAQVEKVALELAKFESGAGKTAVAIQLFGRAGAQLIPFFNDLAKAGGQNSRLTAEQIQAADDFTKELKRLRFELSTLGRTVLADVVPPMTQLLELMRGGTSPLDAFIWQQFPEFSRSSLGRQLKAAEEALEKLKNPGDWGQKNPMDSLLEALGGKTKEDRIKEVTETIARLQLKLQAFSTLRPPRNELLPALDDPLSGLTGRALNFKVPEGGARAKESEAQRYLKSLERTYEAAQDLTHYEQLMWDVQSGRLGAVTPKQLEYAVSLTKSLDAQKAAKIEAEKQAALDELITKSLEKHNAEQERLNKQLQDQASAWLDLADPMRKFIRDLEEIDGLVAKGFLSADQAKMIRQNLGEQTEKGTGDLDQYAVSAAQNMQSAFADYLFDPFKDGLDGMLKNFGNIVQRMIAEAAAAQLMKYLFGDFAKTGIVGGVIGGFGGGASLPQGAPFATGTNYVPYDGFQATLHKGEAVVPAKYNPAAGGMVAGVTIHQTFNVGSGASRADMVRAAQAGKEQALAGVADAMRRGNL